MDARKAPDFDAWLRQRRPRSGRNCSRRRACARCRSSPHAFASPATAYVGERRPQRSVSRRAASQERHRSHRVPTASKARHHPIITSLRRGALGDPVTSRLICCRATSLFLPGRVRARPCSCAESSRRRRCLEFHRLCSIPIMICPASAVHGRRAPSPGARKTRPGPKNIAHAPTS